ncbi:MAG: hypothetical protein CL450_08760 [Acidimicrobiaceae bacterium]|nr:hypothetical protein [Acidimicrobiaceae bacterium]
MCDDSAAADQRRVKEAISAMADGDTRWRMCQSFLLRNGITSPQQRGYEHFMNTLLPEIIQENSSIHTVCEERKRRDEFWFAGVTVLRPKFAAKDGTCHDIGPTEAMRRRTTYECEIRVDVHHKIYTYPPDDEWMDGSDFFCEHKVYRNVSLFHIPCMVRSRYCHWHNKDVDPANVGGYFVIQGHEKGMIELQKMRTNWPVTRVTSKKKNVRRVEAEIRSASGKWRSTSTMRVLCEATSGGRFRLFAHVPFVQRRASPLDIPLVALFKMMRVESIDDMMAYIFPDQSEENADLIGHVRRALEDPAAEHSKEDILQWLIAEGSTGCRERTALKKRNYILHVLKSETLPHNGVAGVMYKAEMQYSNANSEERGRWGGRLRQYRGPTFTDAEVDAECHRKCIYIGFVVRRLVHIFQRQLPEDDRDHFSNKRLDTPGPLLAYHFRLNFRGFLRQLPAALEKASGGFLSVIDTLKAKAACLTSNMREPFKRGNWSMQPGVNNGVVQNLNRVNPFAVQSFARKIMTPLKKEGKIAKPRQVHLSQQGLVCCVETPEGQACGLILVLTLFARIGLGVPTHLMQHMLKVSIGPGSPMPLVRFFNGDNSPPEEHEVIVMVNGAVFGTTSHPRQLEDVLIKMRRHDDLPNEMRVVWHRHGELRRYFHINSDCSAAMRPVLRVDKIVETANIVANKQLPVPAIWNKLMSAGCVEYLDKEEEEARRLVVASRARQLLQTGKYSHLELDPTSILGLLASIVPYSDLNQSPRNMYFTSMVKAALTLPCLDYESRVDMHQYAVWYPQRPLTATRIYNFMIEQSGGITGGQTPIWCVACLDGHNMEDSIYVKKSAIDRGLFMMTYFRTFFCEAKNRGSEEETFEIPPDSAVGRKGRANYSKLGEDGIVPEGTKVKEGDVLIGKCARMTDAFDDTGGQEERFQDRSIVLKKIPSGVVHSVTRTTRSNGSEIVWVKIRCVRRPEVGDKFASFAAQKGTIGQIIDDIDMPQSMNTGMIPDVVMNTHAIPSRMTIGMMVEALMGKAAALDGKRRCADSFQGVNLEDPKSVLKARGFRALGKEKMIDGRTGRVMPGAIYMAPVSYMRQKHMVSDKLHSRARGPRAILTRQPTEGRSRDGGIRFGEMERDAILAHSAAFALRDRLCDNSDATPVAFCKKCGLIAEHAHSSRFGSGVHEKPYCRNCKTTDAVVLQMPFASKLLLRELQAMHITAKVEIDTE